MYSKKIKFNNIKYYHSGNKIQINFCFIILAVLYLHLGIYLDYIYLEHIFLNCLPLFFTQDLNKRKFSMYRL